MRRLAVLIPAAVLLASSWSGVRAETLPLPPSLIALDSDAGAAMLTAAGARKDYFDLSIYFVTQINPAFCGPASISMVMNALDVPRTPSPGTEGYGLFDQSNIFSAKTEVVKPQSEIMRNGLTLDQLGQMLGILGVKAEVTHAADSSLDAFRKRAVGVLGDEDHFILVNFLRSALGEKTNGHISPLGAYDAASDRFLILDVSRYKYPPFWVTASALYDAMNTPDSDAGNKTRGFVVVGR